MASTKEILKIGTGLIAESKTWGTSIKTFQDGTVIEDALKKIASISGRDFRKIVDAYNKAKKSYEAISKSIENLKTTVSSIGKKATEFQNESAKVIADYKKTKFSDEAMTALKDGKSGQQMSEVKTVMADVLTKVFATESANLVESLKKTVADLEVK